MPSDRMSHGVSIEHAEGSTLGGSGAFHLPYCFTTLGGLATRPCPGDAALRLFSLDELGPTHGAPEQHQTGCLIVKERTATNRAIARANRCLARPVGVARGARRLAPWLGR